MKYSSRFFLYAPLALFLALAVAAGAMWWRAAGLLSAQLDALNGREAMPGVTLSFTSKTVSGFPFNLDVVFEGMRLTIRTPHGPSTWRAEKFALHALTYGREQMIFEAAGHQAVTWTDLKGGTHAMAFETGELHASVITGERGVTRFDLDGIGFGSPALMAGRVQLHARIDPDGKNIDLFATADAVHLSPQLASLFGADITAVKLDATLIPGAAFGELRGGRTDWVGALETFRTANGTMKVNEMQIAWPHLIATGKGALRLDAVHRAEGLLDFKVAGIQTLLDAAATRHVRGTANAGIAAALLDRAAKSGNNAAGLTGAVVAFQGGMVGVGDETATTEEPLY